MDSGQLLKMIEDAETRLAALRGWLLVGSQNGRLDPDIDSPSRSIRALQVRSAEAGFTDIAEIAQTLGDQIEAQCSSSGPGHREIRRMQDAVVKAEARIASIRFAVEDAPIDVATFVETSFDFLRLDHGTEKVSKDNFEIDSEMLEIFLTEAEELVANIEDNLARLRDDPRDSNALWEIRRSTHTFKGAAAIVGLKKPSELAHKIEDLIDRFADHRVEPKESITRLLSDATRCLHALTTGENSEGLVRRIELLYSEFDALLSESTGEPGSSVEPAAIAVRQLETEETRPTGTQPDAVAAPPGRQIVRISQNRLDELFRIVCDLVVSRSIFEQRLSDFEIQIDDLNQKTLRLQASDAANGGDAADQMRSMNASLYGVRDSLAMLFEHQRQLVDQIHQKLVGIRMVEFGSIAGRLQRTVRSTCVEENKLAEISIENEKLEIDTQIVDHLIEPLMHLLKNAVVHGIELPDTRRLLGKSETGHITLRAVNEETHVLFTVTDDGSGIATAALKEKAIAAGHLTREESSRLSDAELIDLIFLSGITTAEKLTMNAGRGVGMNIVRESIESRQGTFSVETNARTGTTFTIKMPLPMALSKVLIVTASGERFAIPMRVIRNVGEVASISVEQPDSGPTARFGGFDYPIVSLDKLLHTRSEGANLNPLVIFLEADSYRVALTVESVLWSDDVLFKPLGKTNGNTDLLGEGILADTTIVPIPDFDYLMRNYRPVSVVKTPVAKEATDNMVLIIDDSPSVRYLVSRLVGELGFIVETANDGKDALQKIGLTKQKPVLIISDLEMPRMDGYEFLELAKNDPALSGIPIIVLTSRAGEESRQRTMDAGAVDYILKPFQDAKLIQAVEGAIFANA
jgi:chemosensory pili system protein ChpA (sensor histidine kinase/response regulator)